jgi:hypothetical protein
MVAQRRSVSFEDAADHNAIGEYVKVIVIPVPRGASS